MPRQFEILVVDDHLGPLDAGLAGHFSRSRPGWTLRFAGTGPQTLARLDSEKPDAVVLGLDPAQEGREGLKVLHRIRQDLPATPVVILADGRHFRALRDCLIDAVAPGGVRGGLDGPDAFLFREELEGAEGFAALERAIAAGLHGHGRVANETGILVTHGTDTMAWCFAYLRYALKDLTANVAVTGSQVPLAGYYSDSDALGNLKTAVTLLNRLRPAHLFAVFNDGRSVFTGRLTKFRKWAADAFEGTLAVAPDGEGRRSANRDWVVIPYGDQRLRNLHLIRTGGTIESLRARPDSGPLKPGGDFVWKYVTDALSDHYTNALRHDLFALDSSNVSLGEWAKLALEIESIGVAGADTRFDPTVKPVYTNPLFTTADYRAQFAACGAGAVLAGFGGGNANVLPESPHSILPALEKSVAAGTFVAVTSQVPLEPYDAEYETGLRLLEAGGIPCGDLPLADAQVKLSYLLGHEEEIKAAASRHGFEARFLLTAAFLSGVTMRRAAGLEAFRRLVGKPLDLLPVDPFTSLPFGEALDAVARALRA